MQLKQLAEQGRLDLRRNGPESLLLMGPSLQPEHSGEILEYREVSDPFAFSREELAEFRDRFDLIASFRGTLEVSEDTTSTLRSSSVLEPKGPVAHAAKALACD